MEKKLVMMKLLMMAEKLSELIPKDLKEKEILVYDWTIFISQCSQN